MNQNLINNRKNVQIVSPFARKWLRTFGGISSAYVLFIFAINGSLDFLWGVLLVGIGLISLYTYTKSKRRYFSPIIFTVFYFLGYLLSFTDILVNKNEQSVSGFSAIGVFGFTDNEFFPVVLAICTSMAGIMAATLSAERLFRRFHVFRKKSVKTMPFSIRPTILRSWVWIWFICSVFLMFLMWHLEIGRLGLKGKITLPFRLVGVLFFFRNLVVPFGGILLLGLSLNADKKRLTKLILWMLLFVGVLGSIAGISRGYFVFTVFPAFLFMLLTSYKSDWKRKILVRYMTIAFITVIVLVVLVQQLRNVGFTTGNISIFESYRILTSWSDFDLLKAISTFISLTTTRIGGMRELLAASSSGVSDLYAPWSIFISDRDYVRGLLLSVFGFLPASNSMLAFGVGFGLWGMMALSGSYIIIFLGTLISSLLVLFVEELFIRKGAHSVACFFAMSLGMSIWGNIYLSMLIRYAVMITLCYLIMNRVLKSFRFKTKQMLYGSNEKKKAVNLLLKREKSRHRIIY